MLTLFISNSLGVSSNCVYPTRRRIIDEESLKEAVSHDYVCAEYVDHRRSIENFVESDCLAVDVDNDHSDAPDDWVTPDDVLQAFPNVTFAVHYSRSNMKEKNGKAARPKFHLLFPIKQMRDPKEYANLKKKVYEAFPYIDKNALDAARFFFGTEKPKVEIYRGEFNLTDFFDPKVTVETFVRESLDDDSVIPEGKRNATLSLFAVRLLKRHGNNDDTYQAYLKLAANCRPPLEDQEVAAIWRSAEGFYDRIKRQPGYVAPKDYGSNADAKSGLIYKPGDYSDVGQAKTLSKVFENKIHYSPATGYLAYTEKYWLKSDSRAQGLAQELTHRQLNEAQTEIENAQQAMDDTGASMLLKTMSQKKAEQVMTQAQLDSYHRYLDAKEYVKFVLKRRESRGITATLQEARPMIEIEPSALDSNGYLLNTPDATYDLRLGLGGARPHSADDLITQITAVSPGEKGEQIWQESLNTFFCGDQELIDYVQLICGLVAIGRVYMEALIISYGSGRNGKSSFWNAVAKALGTYNGNISADLLTTSCYRNVKYDLAEIRGKRLLIAAEMQEGARLNDSMVKQLCSTDDISAEEKYKTPFHFTPGHTVVLYTNHLPKVSALDDGTWRRLLVIPFQAKIEGNADIKNYAEYLFENAGESILAWVIEGARKVIAVNYKFDRPECVQKAIDEYFEENNWFKHFLEECCEVSSELSEKSGDLYPAYRQYCADNNEHTRSPNDFYKMLEMKGFERVKVNGTKMVKGLELIKKDDEKSFGR